MKQYRSYSPLAGLLLGTYALSFGTDAIALGLSAGDITLRFAPALILIIDSIVDLLKPDIVIQDGILFSRDLYRPFSRSPRYLVRVTDVRRIDYGVFRGLRLTLASGEVCKINAGNLTADSTKRLLADLKAEMSANQAIQRISDPRHASCGAGVAPESEIR